METLERECSDYLDEHDVWITEGICCLQMVGVLSMVREPFQVITFRIRLLIRLHLPSLCEYEK